MKKEGGGIVFGPKGIFKIGIEHWVGCGSCAVTSPWYRRMQWLPRWYIWFPSDPNSLKSLEWLCFFLAFRHRDEV